MIERGKLWRKKREGVNGKRERVRERGIRERKIESKREKERRLQHRNGFIPVLQILDASELGQPAPRS